MFNRQYHVNPISGHSQYKQINKFKTLNQKVMTEKIGDFLIVPLVSLFQSVASKCQIFVMEMIIKINSFSNERFFRWPHC